MIRWPWTSRIERRRARRIAAERAEARARFDAQHPYRWDGRKSS